MYLSLTIHPSVKMGGATRSQVTRFRFLYVGYP